MRTILTSLLLLLALTTTTVRAEDTLPADARASIDKAVTEILATSGAPSASIAVVKDGRVAYVKAYGTANLDTKLAANPRMRYSIGSISKQFTAAAILMLAEEGKLSLDDKLVRWLPELARAKDVTIRQLLSMTSGYRDFWPQDYVMPAMKKPVLAMTILRDWAQRPLDFEPGAKWQYSNTNYVIAGVIVERVADTSLMGFLEKHIFDKLAMGSVYNTDAMPLEGGEPMRYMRYGLGPARPAPKEGAGWMYAAGELAMTAEDLAKWDVSVIERRMMSPASYAEMEKEVLLTSGAGTHYGLGVGVSMVDGRRQIAHGGEVSGFTARNEVYPDERAAIVVLTNIDAATASGDIAAKIANVLFNSVDEKALDLVKRVYGGLQKGQIDRALFTDNANDYFSEAALKDFASSLGPLGKPQEFTQIAQSLRGGMTLRRYRIKYADKALRVTTFTMPDGKLEQYTIAPIDN